jgi:hypothetical protein
VAVYFRKNLIKWITWCIVFCLLTSSPPRPFSLSVSFAQCCGSGIKNLSKSRSSLSDDYGSETFDLKFETFSVKNKLTLFATGVDVGFFFDFRGELRQAPEKSI